MIDKLTNRVWLSIADLLGNCSVSRCRWMFYLQVQVDIPATQKVSQLPHAEQASRRKRNPKPHKPWLSLLESHVIYQTCCLIRKNYTAIYNYKPYTLTWEITSPQPGQKLKLHKEWCSEYSVSLGNSSAKICKTYHPRECTENCDTFYRDHNMFYLLSDPASHSKHLDTENLITFKLVKYSLWASITVLEEYYCFSTKIHINLFYNAKEYIFTWLHKYNESVSF